MSIAISRSAQYLRKASTNVRWLLSIIYLLPPQRAFHSPFGIAPKRAAKHGSRTLRENLLPD
jgi:hypothetical protein